MLRRIPIRVKVAGALALPLVGLVAAVVIGVSATNSVSESISRQTGLASASVGHAGLIGALQDERNQSLLEMLGLGDAPCSRCPTRPRPAPAPTRPAPRSTTRSRASATASARTTPPPRVPRRPARPPAQADAAIAAPGLGQRETRTRCSPGTPRSSARCSRRTTGSRSRSSIPRSVRATTWSTTARTPPTPSRSSSSASSTSARAGRGRPADRGRGDRRAAARRRSQQHCVQVRGTGDYAGAAEALAANPRVSGLPGLANQVIAESRTVDPAALAVTPLGPDGGYPKFRETSWRARRAGRRAASRRRRPPPALPRRRAGARRGRGGHRGLVSRSITRPCATSAKAHPWPPTGCRSRCRTSSTPRPARTW